MKAKIAYTINGLVGGLTGKSSERKDENLIEDILNYCKSTIDSSFENYDVDFFLFSWHQDKSKAIDEIFKPKASKHIEQFQFEVRNGIDTSQRTQNHLSRWFGFREVINLLSDYCEKTKTEYDYVINARFDICWNCKFELHDKNKVLLSRYVGDFGGLEPAENLFNIDKWNPKMPNLSPGNFYPLDLADFIVGSSISKMKEISNITNRAQEFHLAGNGRGSTMSHHRLLPAFLKEAGVVQKNVIYLHNYNQGGWCGDFDLFRYRKLTADMLKSKISTVKRPWGVYTNIGHGDGYNLKKIVVSPGQQPSYQYHHFRSEHWIIIEGEAEITIDDQTKVYSKNDAVFVPTGSKHRVKNLSKDKELVFIEVQTGSYFGEDDIVRVQDDYERSA